MRRAHAYGLTAEQTQVFINMTDVDAECVHGSLPLDGNRPVECHCWDNGAAAALAERYSGEPDFSMDD